MIGLLVASEGLIVLKAMDESTEVEGMAKYGEKASKKVEKAMH